MFLLVCGAVARSIAVLLSLCLGMIGEDSQQTLMNDSWVVYLE